MLPDPPPSNDPWHLAVWCAVVVAQLLFAVLQRREGKRAAAAVQRAGKAELEAITAYVRSSMRPPAAASSMCAACGHDRDRYHFASRGRCKHMHCDCPNFCNDVEFQLSRESTPPRGSRRPDGGTDE